ncbi:uncharacterized protein CLUP02_17460 [Colletotrichum lupini]|uniref:C2H2 type zinc finger containing protein n=1 Tax=Colletotrichum lupini TaxID=145971 RepID=A0A9Q8WAE3_9PEZI|nr:uncharacterized protein CLUP02_17460 [Colletotrichum lupini]UQC75951.1 hypothetical protein CLUP02_17460 [Colletotrichum lupini]
MTTIPEDTGMDEFVNWEAAATEVGNIFNMPTQDVPPTDPNLDLVLENADDDDFGFVALEHFSGDLAPPGAGLTDGNPLELIDTQLSSAQEDWWFAPETPCNNCILGGYSCKQIKEGKFKSYCTSCVALRSECSLAEHLPGGLADLDTSDAIPSQNPWPIMGDHPRAVQEDDHMDLLSSLNAWPAMGDHPRGTLEDNVIAAGLPETSAPDLLRGMTASAEQPAVEIAQAKTATPAKVGARFSRESVRILKNWLSTHTRHPYPSDEEKEMLQRQTGLNKTQITNWLANARRRGKTQAPRSTSPHPRSYSGAIDIPQRRGTPAPDGRVRNMNPLERWVDSPPENEPATVSAIALAVASSSRTSSSGLTSPYSFNFTDDGSGKSLCNASSASSLGTSHGTSHSSGGSFASAYSHASRGSFGSFGSFNRGRRRRRRRVGTKVEEKTALAAPPKTFQCTFCTESFRTKHDWQRHEKSLHLSLERWVCAPDGPVAVNPATNQLACVFCGEANPDNAHVESHNHSACQERLLQERCFYRKDHLNQHLRLVHDCKFVDWSMKAWKVATPEIRSRCGFCGVVLDSWGSRVEHIANHYRSDGNTMADWKGDWGFEAPVLEMVENSIPPYLIDNERNSPYPYKASGAPAETPRNAYELIKIELAYFMQNHYDKHQTLPDDRQMQLEACRIIFASEILSIREISSEFSWLRDLIMSDEEVKLSAKYGPIRQAAENRLSSLKLASKDTIFQTCPLENQLHEFVRAKRLLGLTAMDDELQQTAAEIVGRVEEVSISPSDHIASWLVRCIFSSTNWLANFRQRAHLPRTEDIVVVNERSTDTTKIDSTIHNYSRLEHSLADFMDKQRALGIEPDDAALQREARMVIYEFDDGWNQTAADNLEWLAAFRQRHQPVSASGSSMTTSPESQGQQSLQHSGSGISPVNFQANLPSFLTADTAPAYLPPDQAALPRGVKTGPFFLNDANCYRRLARTLKKYTVAAMSADNPHQHTPSDAELQLQARLILYDDDDPWNQTAADNAEWLRRFKRDAGIIAEPGPGLPPGDAWSLEQGGTGFAPPYAFPKGDMAPFSEKTTEVPIRNVKFFQTDSTITNKYLETFKTRYPKPATIFCARELEDGLIKFVESEISLTGSFPDDEAIRVKARMILNSAETAADDPVLLGKFKGWMMTRGQIPGRQQQQAPVLVRPQPRPLPTPASTATATSAPTVSPAPAVASSGTPGLTLSDAEMNDILQDMNFDLSAADLEGLDVAMGMDFGTGAGPA